MMMAGVLIAVLIIGGLVLVLIVGGILLLQRNGGGGFSLSGTRSPTAREALDERYARGEITEEEYQRMLAQIET